MTDKQGYFGFAKVVPTISDNRFMNIHVTSVLVFHTKLTVIKNAASNLGDLLTFV